MTTPPAKVKPFWDALIEYMLAHPGATIKQIAAAHGFTPVWIGIVISNDMFKEKLAKAREEKLFLLNASLNQKLEGLASFAIEELGERIQRGGDNVPIGTLRDVSEMALKSLGFGQPKAGPAVVQQVTVAVDASALAEAREKMARLRRGQNEAVEKIETIAIEHVRESKGENAA